MALSPPTESELQDPLSIQFDDIVTTVTCHPEKDFIASGLLNGDVFIHAYNEVPEKKEYEFFAHQKKSIRALKFTDDGRRLYSISKDKSIVCVDVETGKLKRKIKKAHESPLYSLVVTGDTFIATGDDDGCLKVWDMRTKTTTMEMKECDDFLSDLIIDKDQRHIIASSGEGTLTSFNIRGKKMDLQSELFDSELLCLTPVKHSSKLVAGLGEGTLAVFHWGQWGNLSDRVPLGEAAVDSMVAVTEDVLCVGTSDGNISGVHMLPNRPLGCVGCHGPGFPVQALTLTADGRCVASCSHDQTVKFWNVQELKSQTVDTSKKGTKDAKKKKQQQDKTAKQDNFFAGLIDSTSNADKDNESDDEDDDEDSDSD